MERAFQSLSIVSSIYFYKSNVLSERASPRCIYYYNPDLFKNFIDASKLFSNDNMNIMYNLGKDVASQNDKLQYHSCPLVY